MLKLGGRDDALKAFDKAVQLGPDDPELWWHMGMSSSKRSFVEHTLKLNPRHADTANLAGRLEIPSRLRR